MFEPLYSAAEMRAAEEGHDVTELMERAGGAVAREVFRSEILPVLEVADGSTAAFRVSRNRTRPGRKALSRP